MMIEGFKGPKVQGKIINTTNNNWLRYPSGMKYAILFTVGTRNQGSNRNRTYLNPFFLAGSPKAWPLYMDRQQAG